jgi:putative nucleotidyltransferase with HDIG domain
MGPLDSIMGHIHHLPLLSPVISRLINLFGDHDHSLHQITKLVEVDPNLTLNVLRSANAAAHSPGREIISIHQAVVRIGEERIFSIVLRACAGDIMLRSLEGYTAKEGELWRHSLMTAYLAKGFTAMKGDPLDASLAYTAGLLHDIGKSVLDHFLTTPLTPCKHETFYEPEEILRCEEDKLGVNHAEAGALLAEHWGLPSIMCEAIRHHHEPHRAAAPSGILAHCIALSDYLSFQEGIGNQLSGLPDQIEVSEEILLRHNLSESERVQILSVAFRSLAASEKMIL